MERINIVGAGIIGLSCAWRLAQSGKQVTLFDAREPAREASWAGAGMLAPGGEFAEPSDLALTALQSLRMYEDFVGELQNEANSAIDYRKSGAVEVALTEAEAVALQNKAIAQASFGIVSEPHVWDGHPARYYPDDAIVDPRDLTRALLIACRQRDVVVLQNEPVLKVAADGRLWTANGEYAASATLIAAGAWSSDLFEGLPPVTPVRGHLVSWQIEPNRLGSILRNGSTYLLQRQSGLIVGGATKESVGFDRSLDSRAIAGIEERAARLYPALLGQPLAASWNGFRPFVEGEVPCVGRIAGTSVWTAYGHYRNGILLAPETASRIAAALV